MQQIFAIAMVDKTISMIVPEKIAEIPPWYHAEVLSTQILSFFQGHALEEGLSRGVLQKTPMNLFCVYLDRAVFGSTEGMRWSFIRGME